MNQYQPSFSGAQPVAGINPYIGRTYNTLFTALAVIVLAGGASFHLLPRTALIPLAIADFVMWIACGWLGWRRPLTLTMGLFTIITGALLGQVAHLTPPGVFMQAGVFTMVTFAGLSLYVHTTKKDFSFLRGFLVAAFWISLVAMAFMMFFPGAKMNLAFAAFGTLTFACFILYDTSNVIHHVCDAESASFAAFELMLDLIGLFKNLLNLLWSLSDD
jgi:FtsH-binding integral membrane protein